MTDALEDIDKGLPWWQKLALAVSCLTFVAVVVLGPWLVVKETSNQSNDARNQAAGLVLLKDQTAEVKAQETQIKTEEAQIKTLVSAGLASLKNTNTVVNYIHQIQTGPQSTASRESSLWVLKEFQAICADNPRCKAVPLPATLATLLHKKK